MLKINFLRADCNHYCHNELFTCVCMCTYDGNKSVKQMIRLSHEMELYPFYHYYCMDKMKFKNSDKAHRNEFRNLIFFVCKKSFSIVKFYYDSSSSSSYCCGVQINQSFVIKTGNEIKQEKK